MNGKRGPKKGSHYGKASVACNKKANPDCDSKGGMCKKIIKTSVKGNKYQACIPTAANRAGGY